MNLFTLMMSAQVGSLLIIIIALLRRHTKFILRHGLVFLTYIMIASILRLICVFELPYTKVIYIPDEIKHLFYDVYTPIKIFSDSQLAPINIIAFIWLFVSACFLISTFIRYYLFLVRVKQMPDSRNAEVRTVFANTIFLAKNHEKFKIIQNNLIDTPMLVGFFKPIILLPDIDFTEDELHTIFLHECSHFYKKDIWIKLIAEIVCAIYWWNPLVYLLRRDLNRILELSCDAYVVGQLREYEKHREIYMQSIIKICRQNKSTYKTPVFTVAMIPLKDFHQKKYQSFLQRTEIILEYRPLAYKKECLLKIGYFLLALSIFFVSFTYIAQPDLRAENLISGENFVYKENSFILHENSEFKLFLNNEFRMTISEEMKEELHKNAGIKIFEENMED